MKHDKRFIDLETARHRYASALGVFKSHYPVLFAELAESMGVGELALGHRLFIDYPANGNAVTRGLTSPSAMDCMRLLGVYLGKELKPCCPKTI